MSASKNIREFWLFSRLINYCLQLCSVFCKFSVSATWLTQRSLLGTVLWSRIRSLSLTVAFFFKTVANVSVLQLFEASCFAMWCADEMVLVLSGEMLTEVTLTGRRCLRIELMEVIWASPEERKTRCTQRPPPTCAYTYYTSRRESESEVHSLSMMSLRANESVQWDL